MNNININPFSKIRAEQMGDSAWKYFVEPAKDYIGAKPLIFEGSRGTGKTMFFKCNSWKEKFEEAKASGSTIQAFLEANKHLGFYYKVDGRFIKSLDKKNVDESNWIGIFNTYFNAVITKEILNFLYLLITENLLSYDSLADAVKYISDMIEEGEAKSLDDLKSKLDTALLKIEKFSNDTLKPKPVGLNAGTVIEKIIIAAKKTEILKKNTFHIFVDEYEVLTEIQQVELNTLLKQSNSDIVYDFGVITKGIQTYKTASGQTINSKDDFHLYSTDRYGYYESKEYNQLLAEICKKRLAEQIGKNAATNDSRFTDISFYLKAYGKKYEEEAFGKSIELNKIKNRLFSEIQRQATQFNYPLTEQQRFYNELINGSAIQIRMHVALLLRKNRNAVPAKELVKHKIENSAKYVDWLHNMETAIIYLLCNELKIEKKYHGFNVYSALSSGVIRSFLELAEYAFDYAFNNSQNPFSFSSPRELTVDEQTKAVYFVSNFKIKEIDSYEPYGYKLRDFTRALGHVFNALQTNPDATLGEVEQNHFETKVNELKKHNSEADSLLKYAIRYKILEEDEPTKTKSDEILEFTDYHLNHIYCPAFKISHLRKRKIPISHLDLAKLFCGSHKELEDVVKKLSGTVIDNNPNLFSESNELSGEI